MTLPHLASTAMLLGSISSLVLNATLARGQTVEAHTGGTAIFNQHGEVTVNNTGLSNSDLEKFGAIVRDAVGDARRSDPEATHQARRRNTPLGRVSVSVLECGETFESCRPSSASHDISNEVESSGVFESATVSALGSDCSLVVAFAHQRSISGLATVGEILGFAVLMIPGFIVPAFPPSYGSRKAGLLASLVSDGVDTRIYRLVESTKRDGWSFVYFLDEKDAEARAESERRLVSKLLRLLRAQAPGIRSESERFR